MPDNPLQPVVGMWMEKIRNAWDFKKKEFQNQADQCWRFFDETYEFMYGLTKNSTGGFSYTGNPENHPRPSFTMTCNKVAEGVQLFGPVLYHRNPTRVVNPRQVPFVPPELMIPQGPMGGPMDPMQAQQQMQAQMQYQGLMMQIQSQRNVDEARAQIIQQYLNYTPEALDLKSESRMAIDEAMIMGMGITMCELYTPPGSNFKTVGNFYKPIRDLVIDSDVTLRRDAKWVAVRCVHPVWDVEREYNLLPGSIKGHVESWNNQSGDMMDADMQYRRQKGETNDLLVYWKIYSKMGMGGRLKGIAKQYTDPLEVFGDYCFLVIAEDVPYPLNIPPDVMNAGDLNAITQAAQWPTPWWADDAWPFSEFIFHERPNKIWPMSHFKPALGELMFLNWCYSFLAGKIKTACRDFVAMKKGLSEDLKSAILNGSDYELLEIDEQHGTVTEAVGFLQHPAFNGDIYKVLEAVEANFEKRTGLTELMYGLSDTQMRSAEEANVKHSQIQVRPDDMAVKVEETMAKAARHEALACRWHLVGADVGGVLGPIGAQMWDQLVTVADPNSILHGLEYRIEAGSARKPNKEGQISKMNTIMQTLFQPLWQIGMQSGQIGPVNALLEEWAKANDFEVGKFLLQPPPMPPPPEAGGEGGKPPSAGGKAPSRNGSPPPAKKEGQPA